MLDEAVAFLLLSRNNITPTLPLREKSMNYVMFFFKGHAQKLPQ